MPGIASLFCGRTDTTCENNDHLFGRGLVGQLCIIAENLYSLEKIDFFGVFVSVYGFLVVFSWFSKLFFFASLFMVFKKRYFGRP